MQYIEKGIFFIFEKKIGKENMSRQVFLLDKYRISLIIRQSFFLPKQSQRSRSILQDGFRSLGLFRKSKIGIITKFHRTDFSYLKSF